MSTIAGHVRAARAIWHRVDAEGREATAAELRLVEKHLDAIARLKQLRDHPANAGGPGSVMAGSGRPLGPGWNLLANSIDLKSGRTKVETSLAGLMRSKELTGPAAADFPPVPGSRRRHRG